MGNRSLHGVSDISSEEGNLRRLSRICSLLILSKPLTPNRIHMLIRNRIGLKNTKVIRRHIRLLEHLSIIERRQTLYVFTDIGKVFCEFLEGVDQPCDRLSTIEQCFYFERFFDPKTPTHLQLCILLRTIALNNSITNNQVIVNYFRTMRKFRVWRDKVIEKNLRYYESDKRLSSFFINKFRCQQKWLEHLGLLKRRPFQLTEIGKRVEKEIEEYEDADIWRNPSRFSLLQAFIGKLHVLSCDVADKNLDYLFLKSFEKVGRGSRAPVDAIKHYLFYLLLLEHKYLEDNTFDRLLHLMVKRKIVASVMRGRNGKVQSVTLARRPFGPT